MRLNKFVKLFATVGLGAFLFFIGFQPSSDSLKKLNRDIQGHKQIEMKKVTQDLVTLAQELTRMGDAKAVGTYPQTAINAIRSSVGMAVGFNSHDDWVGLNCPTGVATQCPPQEGIVGAITSVFDRLKDVASNAGINNCNSLPSTGSINANDTSGNAWTINFETPTHSVPSAWLDGGTLFQKRIRFSIPDGVIAAANGIKVAFEFNCQNSSPQYIVLNMPQDDAGLYKRFITVFTGPKSATENGIETYLAEFKASTSAIRGATALRIEYKPSDTTFKFFGVLGNNTMEYTNGGTSSGIGFFARALLNGNYSTGEASLFLNGLAKSSITDGSNFYYDKTAITNTHPVTESTDLTDNAEGGTASELIGQNLNTFYGGNPDKIPTDGQEIYFRGCADLDLYNISPAHTSDCASYSLNATTAAPYIGTGGNFSIKWVLDNIVTAQETLP